ncbi:MAG: 4,5-DOPA dioxygenase extradiol [bacterium]|nr:4,5-DOPA dioxygenase extradiol [bacterium]
MNRRQFVQSLGLISLAPAIMNLNKLNRLTQEFDSTGKMPLLFVGHGNPMNAISENSITKGWRDIVSEISTPSAILCISAHWETKGTFVTGMDQPRTIHDFGGFPQALFDVQYPAPGTPKFAKEVQQIVTKTSVDLDDQWGLDHGTWSVLVKMFPEATIPVFQMSIDYTKGAQYHYDLGRELKSLREKGVLIIGSGNVVHNLRMAQFGQNPTPYDWALEFDAFVKDRIDAGIHSELIDYQKQGSAAQLSIPTPEHYLPLLYILGLQEETECVDFFNEEMAFASGSMRSLIIR